MGDNGGGVAVSARSDSAHRFALIDKSKSCERLWFIFHDDIGPFLLGVWYRPLVPGEIESIRSLLEEWELQSNHVLGTVLVGDFNVHHIGWLRHSWRNSVEGERLRIFCDRVGLKQIVKESTRGDHLLDLLLTDVDGVRCRVVPTIADHKSLLATLPLRAPKVATISRAVWQFAKADWEGLRQALSLEVSFYA